MSFCPTSVANRRSVFPTAIGLIPLPSLFKVQWFAPKKVSLTCLGTLPDSTRLTNTAMVPKSQFPVSPTDLPSNCLRWPGRRPSGSAADPGLKESIALLISLLEAVVGWCIPSYGGRGRLRSARAGECFSCKAVIVPCTAFLI